MSNQIRQWLMVLLVGLGIIGLAAGTPLGAGPDEPRHLQTAWEQTESLAKLNPDRFVQDGSLWPVDPNMPWDSPCFAFDPGANAGCAYRHAGQPTSEVVIFDYPPPYYWFVGLFERAFPYSTYVSSGEVARIASLLLNVLVLVFVAINLSRLTRLWGLALAVVLPPAALFQMVVVNASGYEISTALLFTVTYVRARKASSPSPGWRTAILIPAIAGMLLATSRPLGAIWLFVIWVSTEALIGIRRRHWLNSSVATPLLGILAGFAWLALNPPRHPISVDGFQGVPGVSDYLQWSLSSLSQLPRRLMDMFTLLGWNDTAPPDIIPFVLVVLWVSFLAIATWIRLLPLGFTLIAVLATAIIPTVIEVVGWADYPQWWQGRYTLPVVVALLALAALSSLPVLSSLLATIAWFQFAAIGIMVVQNALRYAYGLNGFLPIFGAAPAIPVPLLVLAFICGAILIISGVVGVFMEGIRHRMHGRRTDLISAA